MKTQIKKWGDSSIIILGKEYMKYNNFNVGDWIDISDIVKVNKNKNEKKEK